MLPITAKHAYKDKEETITVRDELFAVQKIGWYRYGKEIFLRWQYQNGEKRLKTLIQPDLNKGQRTSSGLWCITEQRNFGWSRIYEHKGENNWKQLCMGYTLKSISWLWTTWTSSTLCYRTSQLMAHAVHVFHEWLSPVSTLGQYGLHLQKHFSFKSMAIGIRAALSPSPHEGAEQMSDLSLPPLSPLAHILCLPAMRKCLGNHSISTTLILILQVYITSLKLILNVPHKSFPVYRWCKKNAGPKIK